MIAAAYRAAGHNPADVRFTNGTGLACPMDDTPLTPTTTGWACRPCAAAWDFHGLNGTWAPTPTTTPLRALRGVLTAPVTPKGHHA